MGLCLRSPYSRGQTWGMRCVMTTNSSGVTSKCYFEKQKPHPCCPMSRCKVCVLERGKWGWEKGMTITTWQTDKYQIRVVLNRNSLPARTVNSIKCTTATPMSPCLTAARTESVR